MENKDIVFVDVDSVWGKAEIYGSKGEKSDDDFKYVNITIDVNDFADIVGNIDYENTGHEDPHYERRFTLTKVQMRDIFRQMNGYDFVNKKLKKKLTIP